MKTLYLDCNMGAAGDMLTAALLELHPDREGFLTRLNGLGLPGVTVTAAPAQKQGIQGTHVTVRIDGMEEEDLHHGHEHHHEHSHPHDHPGHEHAHEHGGHFHTHHHTTVADIDRILADLPLSEKVRGDARGVYRLIAQAEGRAHGCEMEQIHFHEVGTLDAVADVVAVCMLMEELAPAEVLASPVRVGSGHVHCAHGLLPVPAPATAYLLEGVPIYSGAIQGEMCTPTGAALLKHFVTEFGPMPPLRPLAWGYGMGTRDFPAANCLRALLGERTDRPAGEVWELACNLDDMTGEDVAFACEALLAAGALDVWTAPIYMKKGRPAVQLSCLCRPADQGTMTDLLFCHTTTLGVRRRPWDRETLPRRQETRDTPLGPVRYKITPRGEKPEYEDIARLARERGVSVGEIRQRISLYSTKKQRNIVRIYH